MGLDMYLLKKHHVGNNYRKPDEQIRVIEPDKVKNTHLALSKFLKQERISDIVEEVGYWRKANAIHKWFVDNVQNGVDDCNEHYVKQELLEKLMELVKKVLDSCELVEGEVVTEYKIVNNKTEPVYKKGKIVKDATLAKELLPTLSGPFFGNMDYDEFYVDDLKHTLEILDDVFKDSEITEIYYNSSW